MLEVYTKTELEDYTRYLFTNKKAMLIYTIYIIIISYVLFLFVTHVINNPFIIYATYGICALATIIMYRELKAVHATEKEYKSVIKYLLDEKCLIIEVGDFDRNKYEYTDIYDIEETRNYYAIYVSIRHFYLIHKKQLNNEEHMYFKSLIQANVPKSKYKLKKI